MVEQWKTCTKKDDDSLAENTLNAPVTQFVCLSQKDLEINEKGFIGLL